MKVPMKWLKEYVDIDLGAEEYAARMVMTGTAVEDVSRTGEQFDNVVVGYVVSCVDHPNSDHPAPVHGRRRRRRADPDRLRRAKRARGHARGGGAGWCAPARRREDQEEQDARRGLNGMLCSGPELDVPAGLYPNIGDAGIIEIFEDVAPGTDVKEVFGLGDDVVDFEILANRPGLPVRLGAGAREQRRAGQALRDAGDRGRGDRRGQV